MTDAKVSTTAERDFQTLRFTPDTLQGFLDKAKSLFPDQSDVSCSIKASFRDKSGTFVNVAALLAQSILPNVLYDFDLSIWGADRQIFMHRYSKVILSVSSGDEVWSHGVAEVLGRRLARVEAESGKAEKYATLALVIRDTAKSGAVEANSADLISSKSLSETLIWQRRGFWVAVVAAAAGVFGAFEYFFRR